MDLEKIFNDQKTYYDTLMTRDVSLRIDAIKRVKLWIKDHMDLIEDALEKDLGKSRGESYMTEIGLTLEACTYTLKNIKKWVKKEKVKTPLHQFFSRSYTIYEPYGVTLIISPWNYPFLLAIEPLIGTIAAGNCAIVKPSEQTTHTSAIVAQLIDTCFDKGHAYCAEGGLEISKELVDLPFDYIFFTGGKKAGKEIYMKAAETLTPVTLELGGKSPAILTDMIPMEIAAKRIIFGKFLNAGQTCIAPDYILIKDSMKAAFIDYASEYIKKFFGEHPLESENLCKIINKDQFDRLKKLLENQDILIGGEVDEEHLKIAPTIVNDVDFDNPLMEEEIFGPILPLVEYNRIEEAIQYINSHDKPLALYLFSNDSYHANKILDLCSFGDACINDTVSHFATNTLPFGGVGASGIGYYHGKFTFETFSHRRSVLHKSTRIDLPFRYYPLTDDKMKWIKRFLK